MYQISQDFQQLHPEAAGKLFKNWAAMSDSILAFAQREGKLHLVLSDITPGKIFLLVICHNL